MSARTQHAVLSQEKVTQPVYVNFSCGSQVFWFWGYFSRWLLDASLFCFDNSGMCLLASVSH